MIRLVDELRGTADVGVALWRGLHDEFGDEQLLDLLMLCGWYHAISFTAGGPCRSRGRCPDLRIRGLKRGGSAA